MSLQTVKNKLKRHGGHCCHPKCSATLNLTVDHIIPKALLTMLGLPDAHKFDDDNLQIMCEKHNVEKGNVLDYTNAKTLPLLKKYTNIWIEKHSDHFIDPAKRVRKLGVNCRCNEEVVPVEVDVTKWKNPPQFSLNQFDDDK